MGGTQTDPLDHPISNRNFSPRLSVQILTNGRGDLRVCPDDAVIWWRVIIASDPQLIDGLFLFPVEHQQPQLIFLLIQPAGLGRRRTSFLMVSIA